MAAPRKQARTDAALGTDYSLRFFGTSELVENALLPFLTRPEQAALITRRELKPVIQAHLQEIFLKEIKQVVACLKSTEAKDEKPSTEQIAQQELILNDANLPIHEKCKRVFICLDRQLGHYFSRLVEILLKDDRSQYGRGRNDLFNSNEFTLLNLFLKNQALTNALETPNKQLVERAGRFASPPLFETIVRIAVTQNFRKELSTGVVIERHNKKYILTTASSVEDSISIEVSLADSAHRKYLAKRIFTSSQCNLAILEVLDPEFNKVVRPASLGKMLNLHERIRTVSIIHFPESVSNGLVSNIGMEEYVSSGLHMLQVQIDAAVLNQGCCPVILDSQVVGIVHQARPFTGTTFIIPIPVIEHFLTEVFSGKKYCGFPILPIEVKCQSDTDRNGVTIASIDDETDAYAKLKVGDILLEIESLPINNDGLVNIPNLGLIDFDHPVHMKFIGDTVNLKIRRYDEVTKCDEVKQVTVILDCVPKLYSGDEYDGDDEKSSLQKLAQKITLEDGGAGPGPGPGPRPGPGAC